MYFRTKRQLVATLMTTMFERFATTELRPVQRSTPDAVFRAHISEIFRDDMEVFHLVRAWREAAVGDPDIAASHAEITAWTESNVLGVFKHLQKQGKARGDRDPAPFARIVNLHMWTLLSRSATTPQIEFPREIHVTADLAYPYLFRDGE